MSLRTILTAICILCILMSIMAPAGEAQALPEDVLRCAEVVVVGRCISGHPGDAQTLKELLHLHRFNALLPRSAPVVCVKVFKGPVKLNDQI